MRPLTYGLLASVRSVRQMIRFLEKAQMLSAPAGRKLSVAELLLA
jgi:hypothetical protein